ncbi:hypothetical protein [Legionella waltersii]|uniref:Uncharacterized protein n=1 Tax=Legionella waltersii TaxID=66969 RepID=A0A0W1A4K8_9GAMM|nr:hypothetical protein [Legionella waltersii]KTD76306.1 hypothetical protein Lwal_2028 [Legionella waltersii]SNV13590.1 Uncharacterised protein [Legionella waltersii]
MPSASVLTLEKKAIQHYKSLPPNEVKYYLFILLKSIRNEGLENTEDILNALLPLLEHLNALHQLINQPQVSSESTLELLSIINQQLQQLKEKANTHTILAACSTALIRFIGVITGIITGVFGIIIGSLVGLIYGIYRGHPLSGLWSGFFIGTSLGSIMGYRLPNKLLKDGYSRKLAFGIDGIQEALTYTNLEYSIFGSSPKPFSTYLDDVKKEVRELFASDEAFEDFLEHDTYYRINAFLASFIGQPILHGFAGKHVYLQFKIKEKDFIVEYTPGATDPNEPPVQTELRQVSGFKLLEMLALHRKLLETHKPTVGQVLRKMKVGDNDCTSYVNKVLICTNQDGVQMDRDENLKPFGKVVVNTLEALGPFNRDFFKTGF